LLTGVILWFTGMSGGGKSTLAAAVGQRVAVVVNYDSCSVLPPLIDDYSAMVKRLTDRFYSRVTRYGTGGFLKARLESLKPPGGA